MKTHNAAYGAINSSPNVEPRYVFKVSFSDDPADDMYVPSHNDIVLTGNVMEGRLSSITSISQTLNLRQGRSDIGKMRFAAIDTNNSLTNYQRTQLLDDGHGARWRSVQFFHGYKELEFSQYELLGTQILQGVRFESGEYRFQCADIQRTVRKEVFEPVQLVLAQNLDETSTTIEVLSSAGLIAVEHDAAYTDAPNQTVAYVKIDDEIIRVPNSGISPTQLTGCTRGVLATRAAEHTTKDDRGKKVEEVIYLEGPFPKIMYAVLTGVLHNQTGTLPDHWNAGVPNEFIRQTDFFEIGEDWYDPTDLAKGLPVRFVDPSKTDAKRFVERELCRVFSAFLPVYADGAIGLKRNQPVLSGSSPVGTIDDSMLTRPPKIRYAYEEVINDLTVEWNDINGTLTRKTQLKDNISKATWKDAPPVTFPASGVHGSVYSDDTVAGIFERFRDRYSAPPILADVEVLAGNSQFEIGDVIRLKTAHADLYTDSALVGAVGMLHSFEIQNVRLNPKRGTINYKLFGSSADAGPLPASFTSTAIPDAWYTATGTNGSTLTGVSDTGSSYTLIANLHLTGAAIASSAVYYFDKDLIVPQGFTLTYDANVQIRILGVFSVLGELNGEGAGHPGQADTAVTTGMDLSKAIIENPTPTSPGIPGLIGATQPDGALIDRASLRSGSSSKYRLTAQSVQGSITVGKYHSMPGFFVQYRDGEVIGLPEDLRGTSGGGGGYYWFNGTKHAGGTGGNSGAGLVVVCRGMTFAASGVINSSGADGSPGSLSSGIATWSSGGAGGAPGGTLCVVDGAANPIPVKFGHVIADFGDSPTPAEGTFERSEEAIYSNPEIRIPTNRLTFYESTTQNLQMGEAAFRSVLILPEDDPVEDYSDEAVLEEQQISLAVVEAYDERLDPGVTLFRATVTLVNTDASYGAAAIYYRKLGTKNWYLAGHAENSLDFELPAAGGTYQVEARAVLTNGVEAESGFVQQIVTTNGEVAPATPTQIIGDSLVLSIAAKAVVPSSGGQPSTMRFYISATQNDSSPTALDPVPAFAVPATGNYCANIVVPRSSAGTWYIWADATNEYGTTSRYPSGNGVAVTALDNTGGNPGTPGLDGVTVVSKRHEWKRDTNRVWSEAAAVNETVQFFRTASLADRTVQGTRDEEGLITAITSTGSTGEATTMGTPVGLSTRAAYVDITHDNSGSVARVWFVSVLDGTAAGILAYSEDFRDNNLSKIQFDWSGLVNIGGEEEIIIDSTSPVGQYVWKLGNNSGDDEVTRYVRPGLAVPIKLDQLYLLEVIAKRVSGSDNRIYAGVFGLAADGVTRVNTSGQDSNSGQHHFAAFNHLPATGSYIRYKGYFKKTGAAATILGGNTSVENPGILHANASFAVPEFFANYSQNPGEYRIAYIGLREADEGQGPQGPPGADGQDGADGAPGGQGASVVRDVSSAGVDGNSGSVTINSGGGAITLSLKGGLFGLESSQGPASSTLRIKRGSTVIAEVTFALTWIFESEFSQWSWTVENLGSFDLPGTETPGSGSRTYTSEWTAGGTASFAAAPVLTAEEVM